MLAASTHRQPNPLSLLRDRSSLHHSSNVVTRQVVSTTSPVSCHRNSSTGPESFQPLLLGSACACFKRRLSPRIEPITFQLSNLKRKLPRSLVLKVPKRCPPAIINKDWQTLRCISQGGSLQELRIGPHVLPYLQSRSLDHSIVIAISAQSAYISQGSAILKNLNLARH